MVPWYVIVLIIIATLCALFFVPVTLSFKYSGKSRITLYYGFIPVYRFRKKPSDEEKPKKIKKTGQDKEKFGLGNSLKKISKDDNGIAFIIGIIKEIAEIVKHATRDTINNLHIVIKRLSIRIGTPDAAETGKTYGYVCAGIYPALNFINSKCNLKIKHLSIAPDFTEDHNIISCQINIWLVPAFFIRILLSALLKWIKVSAKIDRQSALIDAKNSLSQQSTDMVDKS